MSIPAVRFRVDFRRDAAVGPGKISLLEHIGACGSLSQAARELHMSYRRAWQLGGDHTRSSFSSFKAGFSNTVRDVVVITGWQGYTVTADFKAVHTDGTVQTYMGTYVIGNGVITSFSVHQVG